MALLKLFEEASKEEFFIFKWFKEKLIVTSYSIQHGGTEMVLFVSEILNVEIGNYLSQLKCCIFTAAGRLNYKS